MVETTKRSKSTGTEVAEKAAHTEQRRNGERNEEDNIRDVACDLPALRAVIVTNRRKRKPLKSEWFAFPSIRDDHVRPALPAAGRTRQLAVFFVLFSVPSFLRVIRFLRTLRILHWAIE